MILGYHSVTVSQSQHASDLSISSTYLVASDQTNPNPTGMYVWPALWQKSLQKKQFQFDLESQKGHLFWASRANIQHVSQPLETDDVAPLT